MTERSFQRVVTQLTLGLGVGLLLLGILLAINSSKALVNVASVDQLFEGIIGGIVLVGTLLVGTGVGLVRTRTTRSTSPPEPLVRHSHKQADDVSEIFLAQQFNQEYTAVLANGDFGARERVREQLRNAAIETVVTVDQRDPKGARELVLSGDWTDDPIVKAFVGDETADDPPLKWQVYAWLYDDRAFERSVERALTEIEEYGRGVPE